MLWTVCTDTVTATLCVGLVALLGDKTVGRSVLHENARAIVDNLTHGAIGLLSWHIVTTGFVGASLSMRLCEVVFCGLVASAVDLDHFAAARSLRIQEQSDLEIFAVVTGSFSVAMVVVLFVLVIVLYASVNKLKKQMSLQSHLGQHSYNNPAIQPNEELGMRGFSMFRGPEDGRPPNAPHREEYARNFNSKPQPPADRAPYMPGKEEFFGKISNQPRQPNFAY